MKENWIQWGLEKELDEKYYINKIDDNSDTFLVFLTSNYNDEEKIIIEFKTLVHSYRSTTESGRLSKIDYLDKKYGKDFYSRWTFFQVENSEYVSWLERESCGIFSLEDLSHFSIIASDAVIDIISNKIPEITVYKGK